MGASSSGLGSGFGIGFIGFGCLIHRRKASLTLAFRRRLAFSSFDVGASFRDQGQGLSKVPGLDSRPLANNDGILWAKAISRYEGITIMAGPVKQKWWW